MLLFVTGASGSGKSACLPHLRRNLPNLAVYNFDSIGVPPDADAAWRQRTTEHWLQRALEHQAEELDTIVCGNAILGEILACPSAPEVEHIAVCLLDCYDVVRIDRIRARGTYGDTQDMLNWAAWQRMHAVDPQWRQDIIKENGVPEMQWERWSTWQRGDPRWQTWVLDTTDLAVEQVAKEISTWVRKTQAVKDR
jgi:hypothetical protein